MLKIWRIISKLRKLPSLIRQNLAFDPQQNAFFKYFSAIKKHGKSKQSVVLVQCVEDLFYFGLFGQIINALREHQSIRVEQFVLRSLNVGEAQNVFAFLYARLFLNPSIGRKWIRLFNSFCDGVAYRSVDWHPISDIVDLYRSWRCWKQLGDKKALISLKIDDVTVGDLVNDSYLRFKPAPTVDLKDRYLWISLWQAYRDVRRAKNYFARVKPRIFLTSYTTYIQHGIAVRVALQHGVRVFAFGNYQEFSKELKIGDWVHTKNPDKYASDFIKLDAPSEKLGVAETAVAGRMAGVIDSATAYMKMSAYAETDEPVPDVQGAMAIFLHDFYDSPHVYREMVFPDFWEWICFTIDMLNIAQTRFIVKPHPNQISLSDGALGDLKLRYPNLHIISPKITNKQLAEAGLSCAVTVYGTVAHEMAYLGVPTIACAHHPHISFNFCRTARSKVEYAEMLRQPLKMSLNSAEMRRQSLIFYYMHNLNLGEEMKALLSTTSKYRQACSDQDVSGDQLIGLVEQISSLPGYSDQIYKWLTVLNSDNGIDKGDEF